MPKFEALRSINFLKLTHLVHTGQRKVQLGEYLVRFECLCFPRRTSGHPLLVNGLNPRSY